MMADQLSFKDKLENFFSPIYKNRVEYNALEKKIYLKRFGIVEKKGKYKIKDRDKLEKAYLKAWDNRNFEIDKFWSRAAYFWGFIVLIFGAYITVLSSEHNKLAISYRLDLYLVILGFIFSIAWNLVILGSKSWQQNWEGHIDNLENFVSGPIYKTMYCTGIRFYSVSKINEVLSILASLVWISLIIQYYSMNFTFGINYIDISATLSIIGSIVFIMVLRFGYCLGGFKTEKNNFIDRWD